MPKKALAALAVLLAISLGFNAYLATTPPRTLTITETLTSTVLRTETVGGETVTEVVERTITATVTETLATTSTVFTEPPRYPITLVDSLGREVVIEGPVERIVSTVPSNTEIIADLGALDLLVGVDDFSDYPPELLELIEQGRVERIGGNIPLNVEKVAELEPDLVVISAGLQGGAIPKLEELGLRVLAVKSESLSDIYQAILLVGKALDRWSEAVSLVEELRSRVQEVWMRTGAVEVKRRVMVAVWLEPVWTAGNNTYMNDLITSAGGYNIFQDLQGWAEVGAEAIVERNPQVIIVTMHGQDLSYEEVVEKLRSMPGLSGTDALKNGEVYLLVGQAADILERPGPRVADGVMLLSMIMYQELYGVSLPKMIGDDYLDYVRGLEVAAS